jgi:proteasome lid subunit RPN8/RPN11
MTPETFEAFNAHADQDYPREACGLIVRRAVDHAETYVPCRNIASGEDHFRIHPEDWAATEDQGEILAVCHSHPDAPRMPSTPDVSGCDATRLPWMILGNDGLHRIDPTGYEFEGRPFIFGWSDCYTLVRDWMGATWPEFPRSWGIIEGLFADHMREMGLIEVQGDFSPGDVLLMQIQGKAANHAAIYLGGDDIIHHRVGLLSGRDQIGPYLDKIRHIFRRPAC